MARIHRQCLRCGNVRDMVMMHGDPSFLEPLRKRCGALRNDASCPGPMIAVHTADAIAAGLFPDQQPPEDPNEEPRETDEASCRDRLRSLRIFEGAEPRLGWTRCLGCGSKTEAGKRITVVHAEVEHYLCNGCLE